MRSIRPNPKKRGYLLPAGCKDLIHLLHGPPPKPSTTLSGLVRVNGRITAAKVQVVGARGERLGVMALREARRLARASDLDLVEIGPNEPPPACRIVDYGRFRYESLKQKNTVS